jgi:hypothetical protein
MLYGLLPIKKGLPANYMESPFTFLTPRLYTWYLYIIRVRALCVNADDLSAQLSVATLGWAFF